MPSRRVRLLCTYLRLMPDAVFARVLTHPPRRRGATIAPRAVHRRYDVVETRLTGGGIATARRPGATGPHLVLLHGGAYTLQDFHWSLLGHFLERDWTVSLVDYPLAPEHTVDETVEMVFDAWTGLAEEHGDLHLMGDSAGGGLALVLLQQLRDRGGVMPARSVLLSPWVDAAMTDAATIAADSRDVVLPLRALRRCAEMYAGGRPLEDPRLSPVNGDLSGLGHVQAWVGTEELFLPQCERLAERAAGAPGTDLELRIGHGLPHDWALFPVVERDLLLAEVTSYLSRPTEPATARSSS